MSSAMKKLSVANMAPSRSRDALARLADEEHEREWSRYERHLIATGDVARLRLAGANVESDYDPTKFNNGKR